MTAYYIASDGSNTSPYDTWAKAATTFSAAVTAATGNGDIIYVDQGFTDTLSDADVTYTFGNNVNVICSNDKANEPPQTLGVMGESAWIGHSSTYHTIRISSAYRVFMYGITFRLSSSAGFIINNNSDGGHIECDTCYFWAGGFGSYLRFGQSGGSADNTYTKLINCTFRLPNDSQTIAFYSVVDVVGGGLSSSGANPTYALDVCGAYRGGILTMTGTDLSFATNNLFSAGSNSAGSAVLSHCKLGSGVTVLPTQTPANKSSHNIWLYNCSSGDQHYHLQHHDAFGSTIVDTGIYANDGAQYDGTNYCSWKIVTTANCSYYTPYVSPWIDCYHSGTSAITPYVEILRSGSATAYQDDEVWVEFSYQGTSGAPLATIVSDRKALLAAAADQTTGALGAGDWTGENATSWFGKLNPTSAITPAEIGHLRARVCVGEPEVTVYVDPTIRGRS